MEPVLTKKRKKFWANFIYQRKKYWKFVSRKGGSDVNICDSLKYTGKQDYPANTVRVICRIACCMDSVLNVNCLQVQQQSNSIDCGASSIAFAVEVCFELPPNERCFDAIEMRNHLSTFLPLQELSPFTKISIRVPR